MGYGRGCSSGPCWSTSRPRARGRREGGIFRLAGGGELAGLWEGGCPPGQLPASAGIALVGVPLRPPAYGAGDARRFGLGGIRDGPRRRPSLAFVPANLSGSVH